MIDDFAAVTTPAGTSGVLRPGRVPDATITASRQVSTLFTGEMVPPAFDLADCGCLRLHQRRRKRDEPPSLPGPTRRDWRSLRALTEKCDHKLRDLRNVSITRAKRSRTSGIGPDPIRSGRSARDPRIHSPRCKAANSER